MELPLAIPLGKSRLEKGGAEKALCFQLVVDVGTALLYLGYVAGLAQVEGVLNCPVHLI